MKLLLTADLHIRMDWYAWLASQQSDLTIIAGDLLDGFHKAGTLPQMLAMYEWCHRFPGNLALCSGNHDANDEVNYTLVKEALNALEETKRKAIAEISKTGHWMDSLSRPGVVTDRRNELLETSDGKVIITTIPFSFLSSPDPISASLWKAGSQLRKKTGAPWIVLHHEPPAKTQVGGIHGDGGMFYRIREWRPDFLISGHIHYQPYHGSFADKLAATWCFNPGYPDERIARDSLIPNHIVLDLAAMTATWHASSMEGSFTETQLLK